MQEKLTQVSFIAGRDFDATPLTVVFSPGDQSKDVQIPIVCDTDVEGTETFSMSLSINATNSRLRLGTQRTATGNIEDSTSKCSNMYITAVLLSVSSNC